MVVDLRRDERADRKSDEEADERVDAVFRALADATRRDIVVQAMDGGHSVSALARRYPMSFAAVQKHVAVLERAGLVTKRRLGREQLVLTDIDAIRSAHRLLGHLEQLWRSRLDRFDDVLAEGPSTDQGEPT
jgi:DNA-binding transcriptional ArsR family regulator